MKISIAMATYNGARYLPEQLASFVEQTVRPDELVVCDDGSNDGTLDVLEDFSATAPFEVLVHRNPYTLRVKRNFERAISLCSGDVIFLSDQDDVWFPGKLERVAAELEAYPSTLVVTNDLKITDATLNYSGHTKLSNIRRLGQKRGTFITGCATAVRSEWTKFALPIPDHVATHDGWLNGLAEQLGVRRIIDEPLQFHRRHDSNVSTSIASNPHGATELEAVLKHGLSDARGGWRTNLADAEATIRYLLDNRDAAAALAGEAAVLTAIDALRRAVEATELRIDAAEAPRWKRVALIARLLKAGHYAEFAGWRSALKDLLRPIGRG